MPYNVFLLPKNPIGRNGCLPYRIITLLNDHAEKALVITLNDNFQYKHLFPKSVFWNRGKIPESFILEKIQKGCYSLVVLYDCFFEYSGLFLYNILKTIEEQPCLLVNVLPIASAVVAKGLYKGELAERIDYPDGRIDYPEWETDYLQICLPFQSKLYTYEKTQLLYSFTEEKKEEKPEEKTRYVSKGELYKKEFHFYQLLKKHIQFPTDLEVFSLFLNELYQELQQGNSSENEPLLKHLLEWSQNTSSSYRHLKYSQKLIGVEYVENITKNVRKIIHINPQMIDKISDFFVEYNRV